LQCLGLEYDPDLQIFCCIVSDQQQSTEDDEEIPPASPIFTVSSSSDVRPELDAIEMSMGFKIPLRAISFGCYVPHSPNPFAALSAMEAAAVYCQQRFGGTLMNDIGKKFKRTELQSEVKEIIQAMNSCGLNPGSENSIRLF